MIRLRTATPLSTIALVLVLGALLFGSTACDAVLGVVAPTATPTVAQPFAQAVAPTPTPTETAIPQSTPTQTATPIPANTPTAVATPTPSVEQIALRASRSVVLIVLDQGTCTGAQVKGGIITAARCFETTRQAQVVTSQFSRAKVEVVRLDAVRDLALLQTDTDLSLQPLEVGMARDEQIGQPVHALAYPASSLIMRSDSAAGSVAVTHGTLTAVGDDRATGVTRIQTDASLTAGGLGGPLLNGRGTLIGIVSFASNDTVVLSSGVAGETIEAFLDGPALPIPTLAPTRTPTPLPTATPLPAPRRLSTGTFVKNMTRNGLGQLKIANKGTLDAVVGLRTLDKKRSALVYVRAKGSYTIKRVPDGTYQVIFVRGEDYDRASGTFTRKSDGWYRFQDTFRFRTTSISGGKRYTIWTVTFSSPGGGNATVIPLD